MDKNYKYYIQMLGGTSLQLVNLLDTEQIDIDKIFGLCVISEDIITNIKRDMLDILSKRNGNG